MPSPDAAARHTGAGVARRQAHHERMRDERAREAAAGNAELPPEDDAVEMASAAQLLDSVAEAGPNYTLLRSKEKNSAQLLVFRANTSTPPDRKNPTENKNKMEKQ
ncbi:hypothetical protein EMIHUDRAFT_203761 [Emiliania huxleyi CCMP1516]|uniref:Uncharacterized protein n=2 Tax=Emiliania huxleyi TaxID=2903 RepID=A0A0D3K0C7_EMIH1|nr:hypothetical protein EMIHUDRAFT_203761 [Emiliania huxleyi CCMP1516]EOD29212.1 hypothetical protein EMIHUDRAFT_203761 [Emiliania huxleyi CCMP1516]|eukprot:XP_005781641.1 hypothetical protein EMIHUDRAFT_203761 [Emiliania huxleyi CCMP1516]